MKKIASHFLWAVFVLFFLTACNHDSVVVLPRDGFAEGSMGDIMRTYFFDYTVDSAYTRSKYEGYIPTPGYDLLVVEITIKNTLPEELPMYDWDFIVLYDDTMSDDQVYDYPITTYSEVEIPETALQTLLPSEFYLKTGESRTGLLLFEVPAGDTSFTISYTEFFENDTTGDTFDVNITAVRK